MLQRKSHMPISIDTATHPTRTALLVTCLPVWNLEQVAYQFNQHGPPGGMATPPAHRRRLLQQTLQPCLRLRCLSSACSHCSHSSGGQPAARQLHEGGLRAHTRLPRFQRCLSGFTAAAQVNLKRQQGQSAPLPPPPPLRQQLRSTAARLRLLTTKHTASSCRSLPISSHHGAVAAAVAH